MQEKKILCIDPNQNILDLLTFNLEASGYIVETNTTGQGALSTDASLILLDPQLSDISGWDLLSSIEKTPIIILSEDNV